jgi:hypothetical protein
MGGSSFANVGGNASADEMLTGAKDVGAWTFRFTAAPSLGAMIEQPQVENGVTCPETKSAGRLWYALTDLQFMRQYCAKHSLV